MRNRTAAGLAVLAVAASLVLGCSGSKASPASSPTTSAAGNTPTVPATATSTGLNGFVCTLMDGGKSLNTKDFGTSQDGTQSCTPASMADLPPFVCVFQSGAVVLSPSADPEPFEMASIDRVGKPKNCIANDDARFLEKLLDLDQRISIFQGVCTANQVRNGAGVCLGMP